MPASRDIPEPQLKILWGLAAGRCGFPDCRAVCVAEATDADPAAPVGEMAHIVAHSKLGPRAGPHLDPARRNLYENLILLCPTHHTLVDKQPNSYTVQELEGWKRSHEEWVRTQLAAEVPSVGFAELEMVTRGLLAGRGDPSRNLTLLTPGEKMARNALTAGVLTYVQMGIAGANEVETFVVDVGRLDPDFGERLKNGFLSIYQDLRSQGYHGDALFLTLMDQAGRSSEFKVKAAALAVLGYLFLTCEVFER